MNWLVETKFATEAGYPNQINLNAMKILSGEEKYPTETCILRSSIGAAKDIIRKGVPNIKIFFGYEKDSFDAISFCVNFDNLLNDDFIFLPFGVIKNNFKSGEVFIRPNSGFKTFSGHVLKLEELIKLNIEDNILCLISSVKNIIAEYRFIIVGKQVVSGSSYLPDEFIVKSEEEVYIFAQTVVDNLKKFPDDMWTLDIAMTNKGFKIIETNSITTSGWYACDIEKTCKSIEEFIENDEDIDRW